MINTSFYLRRLHSLCGLLFLGAVLFEHIFTNSTAILGPEVFDGALELMEQVPKPIFLSLELGAIGIPLLFHGIYGIYIALQAKNNPGQYGYTNNWKFALQRYTAWYLVIFLIWHVGSLRILGKGIEGTPINYALLEGMFQNPVIFVLYILAMFAAIFHFCNGITTFCMTWGIAKGPRAQNVVGVLSMLLAVCMAIPVLAFMFNYVL
jgi:succinate dehydrogenase / fumarate reductase cytochrome b subunit